MTLLTRLLLIPLYRFWVATLRFEKSAISLRAGPVFYLFWHSQSFTAIYYLVRSHPVRLAALVSPSREGRLLALLLQRLGVRVLFGSSDQRGLAALHEMRPLIEAGYAVMIAPDGPTGPSGILKPGIVRFARKLNIPLVPVRVQSSSSWHLRTWDELSLPRPFARCRVILPESPVGDLSTQETIESLEYWLNEDKANPQLA